MSTNKHIVGLEEENIQHYLNNTETFSTIRVVVHNTGAWEGTPHSNNHVSVYLLLDQQPADQQRSIHVDMRTDEDDTRGQLQWNTCTFLLSNSAIRNWDYRLTGPMKVSDFYNWIRYQWGYHRYNFSGGGSGCHYWVYSLLSALVDINALHPNVPNQAWDTFQFWYSTTGATRPNQPVKGQFLSEQEWMGEWFEPVPH